MKKRKKKWRSSCFAKRRTGCGSSRPAASHETSPAIRHHPVFFSTSSRQAQLLVTCLLYRRLPNGPPEPRVGSDSEGHTGITGSSCCICILRLRRTVMHQLPHQSTIGKASTSGCWHSIYSYVLCAAHTSNSLMDETTPGGDH